MAEIFFDIKARFDEVVSARQELARLRKELLKTNLYTSKEVVKSLENAYQTQRQKVKDLTYEIQRYNLAMKMFGEKILSSKDLVQGFIGKAEETKTKIGEGRTILAQSLMCLQSIDERQERWHKPMLRAFERIDRIADKVDRL